eukprot:gnl/TRDRNA2_/TRDRNA2_129391_c0_seq2.p1 gnl/TRDRNA2_/TRDRNA2_129391_c0~~gnl/TRDRNA2_/TRDRNA2_129391_c0_seq2.p1  ORF type:complete len:656 (+),score=114.18 gnl/TRDRNA2_/TRDRNA2_129391_c0_seq2:66-2033(+)
MSHGDQAPNANGEIEIFVPGRICLFGEHSDWAGGYRRFNAEIREGCALVCGTTQGLYARARKLPDQGKLIFKCPERAACELSLDDEAHLRQVAKSPGYYAYIAGTLIEIGKHFRVGGAEIFNYKSDLPIKKGLSSSAAICVLIVRALNQLYDLKLTVHGEMDIAYRGEINTPSRCGRLDQCVAFGQQVTRMDFDSDMIDTQRVRVAATLYLVIVDLCKGKDTKEILKSLNEAYPFPRDEKDRKLHTLLGDTNLEVCAEASKLLSTESDPRKAAEAMGALMTKAQARWDQDAVPHCPKELTAPALHSLLSCPALQPHITGGKGVGSQGDGSAQLVCRSAAAQTEAMKIVTGLGMEPLRLTLVAQKSVRTAVVPIAGACPGMWPATKCSGPWLFPIRTGEAVKPAICWICEELISAGIDKIILIVNEATEAQMKHLFVRREDVGILDGVSAKMAAYDEELLSIGRKLVFVRQDRPTGIRDAVLLAERHIEGEPFVLAWGDHLCSSTEPSGRGCVAQLLAAFTGTRSVASMHSIDKEMVHTAGVFFCREPPAPLPAPLGPRPSKEEDAKPVLWPISKIHEKPTMSYAEEHMQTQGIGKDKFLATFGQYVFTPSMFQVLRKVAHNHFTEAIDELRCALGPWQHTHLLRSAAGAGCQGGC